MNEATIKQNRESAKKWLDELPLTAFNTEWGGKYQSIVARDIKGDSDSVLRVTVESIGVDEKIISVVENTHEWSVYWRTKDAFATATAQALREAHEAFVRVMKKHQAYATRTAIDESASATTELQTPDGGNTIATITTAVELA